MSQATQAQTTLQHVAAWFEIPVADFGRARKFYEVAFDVTLREEAMDAQMKMGVFPHAPEEVSGCIMASPFAKPSADGTVVYVQTKGDLQQVLTRAQKMGSQVLVPKTALPPQTGGHFAVMTDSEGNRVGLFSLQ